MTPLWLLVAASALHGDAASHTAAGGRCGLAPLESHQYLFRDSFDGASDAPPVLSAADIVALQTLSPEPLPGAPPDASNRWADDCAAARLGQRLFFDARFSGRLLDHDNDGSAAALGHYGDTGRVACSGCHLPDSGFSDTRSPGHTIPLASGWGRKKAPALLDVGASALLMWNGRRDTLYSQIFGVLESPVEANSGRLYVAQQLARLYRSDYEAVFGPMPAFDDAAQFTQMPASAVGCTQLPAVLDCTSERHGMPGDHAEYDALSASDQDAVTRAVVNMGKAIGAYERLLSCGPGRFDDWMHGDAAALSPSEQRGAQLFVGKGGCIACHSGPLLSDQRFHNVGLIPKTVNGAFVDGDLAGASAGIAQALADPLNSAGMYSDGADGRLPASVPPALLGAFKTPPLRCVGRRPSFMRTGQLATLDTVVDFFNAGGDQGFLPGTREIAPLGLSAAEKSDLVHFLRALDGSGPAPELLGARTTKAGSALRDRAYSLRTSLPDTFVSGYTLATTPLAEAIMSNHRPRITLSAFAVAVTCVFAAAPVAVHAQSANPSQGFFIGGNLGQAQLDKGLYDDSSTGYALDAGYRWATSPRLAFGVEAGYVDLGRFDLDAHQFPGNKAPSDLPRARVSGWTVGGDARLTMWPHWYASAHAGLFQSHTKGAYRGFLATRYATGDESGTHYYAGAGIGYDIDERFSVGLNVDYYDAGGLFGPDASTLLSSIRMEYRFH